MRLVPHVVELDILYKGALIGTLDPTGSLRFSNPVIHFYNYPVISLASCKDSILFGTIQNLLGHENVVAKN